MKKFLKFFLAALFFAELFMIMGGAHLVYDSTYYLYNGIVVALLISVLLFVLDSMSQKIEKLEKKIEILENKDNAAQTDDK